MPGASEAPRRGIRIADVVLLNLFEFGLCFEASDCRETSHAGGSVKRPSFFYDHRISQFDGQCVLALNKCRESKELLTRSLVNLALRHDCKQARKRDVDPNSELLPNPHLLEQCRASPSPSIFSSLLGHYQGAFWNDLTRSEARQGTRGRSR